MSSNSRNERRTHPISALVRSLFGQRLVDRIAQSLPLRRVPELIQMEATECGATCLAMILHYYGCKAPIAEVRERCGIGRDGTSALAIVRAARRYGLRDRSVTIQHNDFRFVKLPAIIHWEFNHFVVVERWSRSFVDIVDPAYGRRRISAAEFDASFTGVVIELEPGATFQQGRRAVPLSLRTYLRELFAHSPGIIVQLVVASLVLQVFGLVSPLLTKVVVDQIIPGHLDHVMFLLGLGMFVLVLTQMITNLLRSVLLVYLQAKLDVKVIVGFFEHMLMLPYAFFQQRMSGDLLARMNSNFAIRDIVTSQLISTLLDSGMVVTYLAILLWQSPQLTVFILLIALLKLILLFATNRPLRELTSHELAAQGKMQGYTAEAINGIATLKAAGAEQRALKHWLNLFFDQLNISVRRSYVMAFVMAGFSALDVIAPLLLLWVGTQQVLSGSMSVGTMLALISLSVAFFAPLSGLIQSVQQFQMVRAQFERIADVISVETEQQDAIVQKPAKLSGRIELKNVSFRYSPQAPSVLKNINIAIEPGQKIAIVGPTGSGKSSLGKLLVGLFTPVEGDILYDGVPLAKLEYQALRNQFGVVLQEAFIFSGSIRSNIAFNQPDMDIDRVIEASQMAVFHDDIIQMPMAYRTPVAEGGSALSGGQRQRLALARAIAHNPAILLLDEATSHLDGLTEQRVEANLSKLECTRIVIAHRLSTVRNADTILVLNNGEIVERGSHDALLAQNGFYARMVQGQVQQTLPLA